VVEQNSNTQTVYGPTGKLALVNGGTLIKAFVPLPAGAQAVYTSSGLAYYRHPDWLGSSRLATTPSRTKYYDVNYAPYGESYGGSGTTDLDFTGDNQDMFPGSVTGLYDTPNRELRFGQGRWISPDPAGMAAADPTNPQTWNRYAYVGNSPLSHVDPLGLTPRPPPGGYGGLQGGCELDGVPVSCGFAGGEASAGGAIACGGLCDPISVDGGGLALASFDANGAISWAFSFEATYNGVLLSNAAIVEALDLPTDSGPGAPQSQGAGGSGTSRCTANIY
jgi:RHS repeat-associated protein